MFREAFKYYKSKQPFPNLTNVLRISIENDQIDILQIEKCGYEQLNFTGLKPVEDWEVFYLKHKRGLIFIKNPFTAIGQRYWIARCLKDFSKPPNKLNIDAHNYLKQNENWWDACCADTNSEIRTKLRWATLGYHHNWDTKIYSESSKDIFPDDLKNLCTYVAQMVGFNSFNAQAAIVNYYHMNSTLSGHTDHSEQNLNAPLFSFSFGQSAIFLLGGLTEDEPALPIFIDSGDIVIMAKESRLCYHAIPKILPAPIETWNENIDTSDITPACIDEQLWGPFNEYIATSRLNINVRQVLPAEQNYLVSK